MPELISETMQKIIKNAPYEDKKIAKAKSEEESKGEEDLPHGAQLKKIPVSTEEIKVEFPEEKPWKKKKS